MLLSDRLTGGIVAALGAACAYGGSLLPPVPGQPVGPSAFPMVIGAGLLICGLLIAFGIGRGFEAAAEADVAASESAKGVVTEEPGRLSLWKVAIPPGLLVFYYLTVDRLGFYLTCVVIVLSIGFALRGRPKVILPVALIAPAVIHLAFYKLLRVPLADGILKMPW